MTIEELKEASDDMLLIMDVIPDFVEGRRRGLSDEETQNKARAALRVADTILDAEIARQIIDDLKKTTQADDWRIE